MQKNKIEGVRPFNDFFFKSCYYHQLIAGLACLGVDRDNILLNSIVEIKENFTIETRAFFDEKYLEKKLGYKNVRCNINKKQLVRYIDKGHPIIVGVDCYYLKSRSDTYGTQHFSHFILLYGYDLDRSEAYVVDHNYRNSNVYMEKVISLDNLLEANRMFKKGIHHRKYTCHLLQKKKGTEFSIWKHIGSDFIITNKETSVKNLETLRRLLGSESVALKENANNIVQYLQELKNQFFAFSKTRFFMEDSVRQEKITALIGGYSNLLSLFWKMRAKNDYEYANKHQESILRKVEEIETLEESVYGYLLEVCI